VGFAWQPSTGDLYATDNGRDLLGDDFPPCELNRIEDGAFYGWPMINGTGSLDPDHGPGNEYRLAKAVDPAHEFRAHNAPLGITFVTGEQVPPAYREAALVALHGSWNRTSKDGYKVVSLHWRADGTIEERDFAAGFEVDGDVIGRPVDVAEGPDGAFYVSDDYAGVIWRVAYGDARVAPAPPVAADARVAPARPPVAAAEPAGESTPAAPAATPGSDSDQTQRVTRGRDVYEANACAGCHDPERATPGVVVRPLQGLRARYTAGSLMALLVTPPPPMPVPSISRGERVDLALFLLAEFR
jgi:cytochrome c553